MRWRRLIALAVAAAACVAAAVVLPHSPAGLRDLVSSAGPAAPAMALAAWILLTPLLFPGAVLAVGGGLAFGALGGSLLTFAGAVAGGLAAFAVARTAARRPVERFIRRTPRLTRLHVLMERRGFAATLAARMMPGVPVTGLHYAAGVSPVRVPAFAAAIAIGALLRTVPYAILAQALESGSVITVAIAAVSAALGGLTAALLVRHLRRSGVAATP